jgi:hypothetical protein
MTPDQKRERRRARIHKAIANERGDETAARVATAACGEAVMFRDADYGALVLETADGALVEREFGFAADDARALHAVLERYSRRDGERWRLDPDTYGLAVLSTVKQEMRLRGYQADKLAERAVIAVKPGEVTRPDLPADGKVIVHEAVEAGVMQRLGLVAAALRDGSDATTPPSVRYYPRPNAENRGAVRPPFAVARFFVASAKPAEAIREATLRALGDWRDHLVKLSVVTESGPRGKHAVEVGLALPATMCESFLDAAIPTFEHSNILGARQVEFDLSAALTEEERADIESLGRECSGCVRIQQEGTRIVVDVPGNIPGHYGADHALHERLSWLHRVLEPWGPSLRDIGPLAEVDLTLPASPESLAEYKKMTAAQRTAMAKNRKKLAMNPEHQRELLQRRKDWKKNKAAQKKAAVWRKRTSAYREDVNECDEEMGGDDAANMVNGDVVATLASRFAKMPPAWWDTPQGEDALRKAKALIKDEHGEDAAEQFDKQLELLRLTSSPTMKAEAADASLGRTMLKAAGTFVPAAGAKMDGSDDEEEKGISSDPPQGDEDDDGEDKDEDGDGETEDEDEEVDESRSSRPFVLVTERVGPSGIAQALRAAPVKPREVRTGQKGETALYFESEREANVFMSSLGKLGFKYGDDFEYDKRPCGIEYVVSMAESRGVREDFAAYLGEPGRGSKKSQYFLVGRGTNQRLVSGKGRTNLMRLGPASLVTVETEGDYPLPVRFDGDRKALARELDGKIVDEEDNRFGGVENAPRAGALSEATAATVEVFLAILNGVLTQYDQRASAQEAKRGRVNIYRLGILLKNSGFVRQDVQSVLKKDDEESLKKFLASVRSNFTNDPISGKFAISGISKYVVSQVEAWLRDKKLPKYPISKTALGAGGET